MKFDISNYMINRQISKKTQLKVYNYLDYINKKENESPEKGQKILNLISENLKNEVYKEFYGMIMTNSKLFHNKFSKEFIQNVSLHMEEKMYGPGEIVYHEGAQDNPCLYYVLKGKVEMFTHRGDKKHFLGYLKEGDSMGHRCFTASQPQEWSVVTAEVTHLVYITQQRFLDCLKEYPSDQEVFMLTKDEIIFGQNRYMNPCYSCGKQTHMAVECPLIHYSKNKQLFINRHLYSVPEKERKPYKRQNRDKKKSLKQIKRVRNALKVVRTALEYSYFQNTQIQGSQIVLNDKEKDKQFFYRMSKFKFNDENNLVLDSKMSEEFTDNEEDEYDDYCDEEDGSQMMEDHQNSILIEQGNEIAEMQEEDEQTQINLSPKVKKKQLMNKKKQNYQSFQSLNMLDGDEENKIPATNQNTLLQRTLTNQYRMRQKQQLDQSLSQSLDFEKEIANSSFLNKAPSQIMDLNSFNDKSDFTSLKRSSTTKPHEILTTQRTNSNMSQKNLSPPQNSDGKSRSINKQDTFKMSLQPITLYKNFEDVLKNKRLDDSFSPYQISLDDKNLQKTVHQTNNQLFDHLNNSVNKINTRPLMSAKKRNINTENLTPKMNPKASNFKQYYSNNNNNFGSNHNLNNPPIYNQHFYPSQQHYQHNLPLILSNQSSSKQNHKAILNSPALQMYKRDSLNLTAGFGILAAYTNNNSTNPSKKQSQENTTQKTTMIDSTNNNQGHNLETTQKQPKSYSNTQLPYFDSHGNEVMTSAAAFNNYNIQNLNQLLQGINLNQLNMNNPQHNQIIQMIRKRDEFFMPNFEILKDYTIYYPQYNCNNILKKISKKQVPLIQKKKRVIINGNTKTSRVRRNSSLKFPGSTQQQQ